MEATHKAEEALSWSKQALGKRLSDYIGKSESSMIALRSLAKRPIDYNRALPAWRGKPQRKITFRIVRRQGLSTEGINSKLIVSRCLVHRAGKTMAVSMRRQP